MTRYEELCQAHLAREPHQVAIDAIFRELPQKLRHALSEYLEVPMGQASMPTLMAGRPASYVDLYKKSFDQNGEKTRTLCPAGEYLQIDGQGIYHFTIGICVERTPGALSASMLYVEFTIESVDEQSAMLQFEKTSDKLPIELRNPTGYADAAALLATYLLQNMKDPPAAGGPRSPIGF